MIFDCTSATTVRQSWLRALDKTFIHWTTGNSINLLQIAFYYLKLFLELQPESVCAQIRASLSRRVFNI